MGSKTVLPLLLTLFLLSSGLGATNPGTSLETVADPLFSQPSGFVEFPLSVAITAATAGAEIRFTTNGSAPTEVTGDVYTGPITIGDTTVLRAIASKPGAQTSSIITHTYVFLSKLVAQNAQNVLSRGFPAAWGGLPATYVMEPKVVGSNIVEMVAALRSLPSLFISTSVSNLFDRTRGIYVNPNMTGTNWERPISLEWLNTNGQSEFQADCGLRIQGGVSRMVAKHSFRLLFKRQYGKGKLKYDVFQQPTAVKSFDQLVLRGGFNDSWFWGSGGTGKATYIRDEFGRWLQLAMGHPSAHGRFVHLYLNGLYWGLYNVTERPDEKFSAAYLGGAPEDWDANHAGEVSSGDSQAWTSFITQVKQSANSTNYQKLQGNNLDGSRNPDFPMFFDKLDYIDYVILNLWGGNWDWPEKNFWFGRKRTSDSTGFKFYAWDIEGIVDDAESPLNMVAPRFSFNSWVGQPHQYLKGFAEYQLDFADRVQKFCFNGGLLTPEVLTNCFGQLASQMEAAILAEAARWGNGNLSVQSQPAWQRERDYILKTYLTQRTAIVLEQLRKAGMYPRIGAPILSQFGRVAPVGFGLILSHTNTSGTIYFTLDGSDPRVYGLNTVAPGAQACTAPLTLDAATKVRARVLQGNQWSALVEADPNDPANVFRFQRISTDRDTVTLEFRAKANCSYTVLWAPAPPDSKWTKLIDVLAQPSDRPVSLTNSVAEGPARFFRLVSPAQQ